MIEVGKSATTKTEKLNGVDPDKLRTSELSDGPTSSSVIFINELKVKMLIYNFQMGGKSEGNKKMINVPIRMEIKDNDLISETSNNKQYSSQNKKVKIKKDKERFMLACIKRDWSERKRCMFQKRFQMIRFTSLICTD